MPSLAGRPIKSPQNLILTFINYTKTILFQQPHITMIFLPALFSLLLFFTLNGALCVVVSVPPTSKNGVVTLDDSNGPARVFHGIGGLSGGGATSVFLRAYPEPHRSAILDYLFKPNFGASLQILKVEIGGEGQSTDGSEASHWRDPSAAPSFDRGYEWWLMSEAKKRNPNITLYGLPWTWPRWVSCGPGVPLGNCTPTGSPFTNITQAVSYITSWVAGARQSHTLDIDWLGVWNERSGGDDYVQSLRASLDEQVRALFLLLPPPHHTRTCTCPNPQHISCVGGIVHRPCLIPTSTCLFVLQ